MQSMVIMVVDHSLETVFTSNNTTYLSASMLYTIGYLGLEVYVRRRHYGHDVAIVMSLPH